MDLKIFDAAKAYGAAAATGGAGAPVAATGGSSFADLLNNVVEQTSSASAASEATTAKALNGQAELLDVVTAVNGAEMAIETVVAVRDKVIEAYNEILRMPI